MKIIVYLFGANPFEITFDDRDGLFNLKAVPRYDGTLLIVEGDTEIAQFAPNAWMGFVKEE